MSTDFQPMRSLIFVDVAKEEYRHRLLHWLHCYHVQDSISQFEPYVTKYAFYYALPTPPDGERFGACKSHMTEHYWLVNPFTEETKHKAFTEFFPPDVLRWQGNIPDIDEDRPANLEGDEGRATDRKDARPFLFAFLPMWWEDDLKGAQRTPNDGPNYRWQWGIRCPEGVAPEEVDKWLYDEVFPAFGKMGEVTRILTSRVKQQVNNCAYYRIVEMWFDGPEEWHKAAVEQAGDIAKPAWAQTDAFPYLAPVYNIQSIFLPDIAFSDNMAGHRGWLTMR